jgi:signal peptidase I
VTELSSVPGAAAEPKRREAREPWQMVLLSLLWPGLGQLSLGQTKRGWTLLLLADALAASALWELLSPGGSIGLGIALGAAEFLLSLWNLFDAHAQARALNSSEFEAERRGRKDPWLAVTLTHLLPGLGHFYLGRIGRGILLLLAVLAPNLLPSAGAGIVIQGLVIAVIRLGSTVLAYRDTREKRASAGQRLIPVFLMITFSLLFVEVGVTSLRVWGPLHAFRMPSTSMTPTVSSGDCVLVLKWPRGVTRRGDVMVFDFPQDRAKQFMKRVVAVAGDTIEIRHKQLIRNGALETERWAGHLDPAEHPREMDARDNCGPIAVGRGEYFVLGDDRDDSNDSRFFGPVRERDLVGRVYKIYWPLARSGPVR